MNRLKNKLHNSRGASMIIAMVFMLICLFVGGTVLVAATMNSYRIQHSKDQQGFLDQRSAAMLVCDELKVNSNLPLQLIIREETITKTDVTYDDEKVVYGTPQLPTTKIVFEAVVPEGVALSVLQKTAYETAVRKYLNDRTAVTGESLTYNFSKFLPGYLGLDSFITGDMSGEVTFKVEVPSLDNANYKAVYECRESDPKDTNREYDYVVGFDKVTPDASGEKYSQLHVKMRSATGITKIPAVEEIVRTNDESGTSTVRKINQTIISWASPVIEKGA